MRGLPARWARVTAHIWGEPFGATARFLGAQWLEWAGDTYRYVAFATTCQTNGRRPISQFVISHKIFFRHGFPGHTQEELVEKTMPDVLDS